MNLPVEIAGEADAFAIASLQTAVAEHLTRRHGPGHWSRCVTEGSVLRGIRTSKVLVVRDGAAIVATLRLLTKKPWAIRREFFVDVPRPLYLVDMAVVPGQQRQGVGRYLLEEAKTVARAWPSDAIRLDAYDAEAGAGGFYAKCGFREAGRFTYRKTPLVYFEMLLS